ncbi:ExbD/TolR family protein [Tundrisphaera sp. TA3]|uniref:ExbD/TolR family protein n=1 Tax=Tundrisphaera sp. TA3 TaxID=3435775 RepID=UPI003EB74142
MAGFWDVFRSEQLEVDRLVATEDVRAGLASGHYRPNDLIRPGGTQDPWVNLGDSPTFLAEAPDPSPAPPEPDPPPARRPVAQFFAPPEDADPDADWEISAPGGSTSAALPVLPDDEMHRPDLPELDEAGWLGFGADEEEDEDEAAAEFTLARGGAERVEELDLAAMVDVAFQLVLFFLVTATTVMFKTLEVPRPADDKPPEVVAQGRPKPVEELEKDFILVEVDGAGALRIDHQPVPGEPGAIATRLRSAREATGRTAMLLSADYAAPHRAAVLAYDAASEVGLQVAVAQPTGSVPP